MKIKMVQESFSLAGESHADARAAHGDAVVDRKDEDVHKAAPQLLKTGVVHEDDLYTRCEKPEGQERKAQVIARSHHLCPNSIL